MPSIPGYLALTAVLVLLAGCEAAPPDEPAPAPVGPEAVAPDDWQVNVAGTEAGEDHPGSVLLTRRAEPSGDPSAFRPRLVLGCEEGVMQVYVEWGESLRTGEIMAAYRTGTARAQPAQTAPWQISADREATGLWHDSTSVPFIRSLIGPDRLLMQARSEDGSPLTSGFVLAGLDSLMTQVRAVCPGG